MGNIFDQTRDLLKQLQSKATSVASNVGSFVQKYPTPASFVAPKVQQFAQQQVAPRIQSFTQNIPQPIKTGFQAGIPVLNSTVQNAVKGIATNFIYNPQTKTPFPQSPYWQTPKMYTPEGKINVKGMTDFSQTLAMGMMGGPGKTTSKLPTKQLMKAYDAFEHNASAAIGRVGIKMNKAELAQLIERFAKVPAQQARSVYERNAAALARFIQGEASGLIQNAPRFAGASTYNVREGQKVKPQTGGVGGGGAKTGIVQKTEQALQQQAKPNPVTKAIQEAPSDSSQPVQGNPPTSVVNSPLTPDMRPSTDIVPQKGKLNVKNLNLSEEGQGIVRTADKATPTVIGNKSVIEKAKLTQGSKRPISDAQQQEILAERLNSRQSVVSLTKEFEELKRSGADEKTLIAKFNEISEQSRIVTQEKSLEGRLLQANNIIADELATPQQKILALLDNAGVDKNKYAADAIKVNWDNPTEAVKFYRKYVPPKLREILTEFRYTNMLSSPLTHIVNIATNAFQSGVVAPVEKSISGVLDLAKSTMTGSERKYYVSDGIKYAVGYYKQLPQAVSKFRNILTGKELSIKPDMERIPTSVSGVSKLYTTPLRALEAADQFYMTLVKGGEEASLQGRGLGAEAIKTSAENSARYRLFRQKFDPDGKLGQGYLLRTWDKYNSVINQIRRSPGGNWIVPFLQTPTNILKQGVEYSPLGIATIPGSKAPIEQLSKTIIGSTVFASAYGLLNSMEFTWDVPKGQKEREYFYAANMMPYSVKVGDKWVSYSKLGPLSYPISMAAALRYAEKYGLPTDKENSVSVAVGGMLKFFSDQSYVKQLGDFIDSVQTGKGIVGGLKMEASNAISQTIPYKSFLGWLTRIIDPLSRKSTDVVSSIKSQLPGLSQTVEPYYNPVTKQPSERTDRLFNALSPIRATTGSKSTDDLYKYTSNAKKAYANLKLLPKEEAAAMFDKIAKYSPAMAREIVKVANEVKLGITKEEKTIQGLSVADGERAYAIAEEFNKLKTPKEKAALWDDYVKKKIITKDVANQLKKLLAK